MTVPDGPGWSLSWDGANTPEPAVPHRVRARVRAGGRHLGHVDGAEIAYDRETDGTVRWRVTSPTGSVLELVEVEGDGTLRVDGDLVEDGLIPEPFPMLLSLDADHGHREVVPGSLTSGVDAVTGQRTTRFRTPLAEAVVMEDAGGFVVERSYQQPDGSRDWIRLEPLD